MHYSNHDLGVHASTRKENADTLQGVVLLLIGILFICIRSNNLQITYYPAK
jgi:hypothetical protein